ncbi:uncharacterized protein [Tenebrio molitor]|uniref:uncharacterized protein n=1 Tax=Tenebrio molitor TaxID=7067 RepID=UPI001C3AB6FB|nr:unnamed protein product [Tenebrio molitor]
MMMNAGGKKLVFNPVLAAPWKTQTANCENPADLLCGQRNKRKSTQSVDFKSKNRRNQLIESLTMRFPGLKKYQAKAALMISENELDKAIVLLEVSSCYRKEVLDGKTNLSYLKNIHINLWYDAEQQDPTLRNVVFESSFCPDQSGQNMSNEDRKSNERRTPVGRSDNPDSQRVGVVIVKTPKGYKANLL